MIRVLGAGDAETGTWTPTRAPPTTRTPTIRGRCMIPPSQAGFPRPNPGLKPDSYHSPSNWRLAAILGASGQVVKGHQSPSPPGEGRVGASPNCVGVRHS